jgi:hypothetical protein
MLNAGTLTFQEFAMREQLPPATIHEAVLDFLRGRDDVVVFGAQGGQRIRERAVHESLKSISVKDAMMRTRCELVAQELIEPEGKRIFMS